MCLSCLETVCVDPAWSTQSHHDVLLGSVCCSESERHNFPLLFSCALFIQKLARAHVCFSYFRLFVIFWKPCPLSGYFSAMPLLTNDVFSPSSFVSPSSRQVQRFTACLLWGISFKLEYNYPWIFFSICSYFINETKFQRGSPFIC